MTEQLKNELEKFAAITQELLDALDKESYDDLELLFCRRQDVIDCIDRLQYTADEFRSACKDYNILAMQEKLATLLTERQSTLKTEMSRFQENKAANRSYNQKFSVDSLYLNKKI